MTEAFIYEDTWFEAEPEPKKLIWESNNPHCEHCLESKAVKDNGCCCIHIKEWSNKNEPL